MNNTEIFFILWPCIGIFVVFMMILINIIADIQYEKFIKSIKVGDIFCFCSDVNLYYQRINEYKHELENPFNSNYKLVHFPFLTCIIKELKESKSRETWVCYAIISTYEDVNTYKKLSSLPEYYKSLTEFLECRERVDHVEIQ